jgi:hypothetical protein
LNNVSGNVFHEAHPGHKTKKFINGIKYFFIVWTLNQACQKQRIRVMKMAALYSILHTSFLGCFLDWIVIYPNRARIDSDVYSMIGVHYKLAFGF